MFEQFKNNQYRFTVTGGAGFIGSSLVIELLRYGQKVVLLDNLSTGLRENLKEIDEFIVDHGLKKENYKFIEGDISNLKDCNDAVKGSDFVLHNGALGSVPRSIKEPIESAQANVMGTLNMLFAAKEEGIKRFVYASSSSIYGDSETLPKVEGGEGELLSPYAVTKAVNELYAKNFQRVYGLETVGLRYFNVFGPRQDPHSQYAAVIPIFVKCLLEDKAPTINGDGETSRDFTHVLNVVQANIKAAFAPSESTGRAYNIACGGRYTLNELYKELCKLLDKDILPNFGPERAGDVKHSNAEIGEAKKNLGFEPTIDFKEGLEQSIEWYKENLLDR